MTTPRKAARDTSPEAGPRKVPEKRGTVRIACGHIVPLSEITLTILGDGLGAQPFCERHGDFFPAKPARKKKSKQSEDDEPLY